MGKNNRQRRAEKARRRQRGQRTHGPTGSGDRWTDFDFGFGAAAVALGQLLRHCAIGGHSDIVTQQFRSHCERHQQRAIDAEFSHVVGALFAAGWTPRDLYEVARRKAGEAAVMHLLDVAAEETARHPAARTHPRWSAQLAQMGARRLQSTDGSPAQMWAQRLRLDWPRAADLLVDLLVVLCSLPVVEAVLPQPGASLDDSVSGSDGIDERVLRKVRALLAKAESTQFEDEANALTAKAQQLMTQYSIERTLAEAAQPTRAEPISRRLWLDNPYLVAKSLLVTAIADANHCRSVLAERWGFVTLVGHEADLDVVELLTTSLLVQATHAMTLAGSQRTRSGVSRTRSYRQSFLVAYSGRIAERLRESASSTEASADSARGGSLLPVLMARDHAVDDRLTELFPQLVHKGVSASNAAGWGAGRAAADLALFDIRDPIAAAEHAG
jgi:hypothetical protein